METADTGGITRRELLRVGALGAVGGALTLSGLARIAADAERAGAVLNAAPRGAPLADPEELALAPVAGGALEGHLSVAETEVRLAGSRARLLTYNGAVPGPLVRVRRGDRLRLHVRNDLPAGGRNALGEPRGATNLHTHGWHVSPADPSDNVMRTVRPGDSRTYTYDLSRQSAGTLGWYHPHVHGLVAEQLWGGLAGPLVVEDPVDTLVGYETHVLVLKDFAVADGRPTAYDSPMDYMAGKVGALVTVNGQVAPDLVARPGSVQRWRLLNASTSRFYRVALDEHRLAVIGSDGGLLDKPYRVTELLLSPGERADVLVRVSRERGTFGLRTLPYSRGGTMGGGMMGGMMGGGTLPEATLLRLRVVGRRLVRRLPAVIDAGAHRVRPDLSAAIRRRFVLGMGMSGGMGMGRGMGGPRGSINGRDYDVDPLVIRSRVPDSGDAWEVWTIVNPTGMDHPWHQHTNHAQILSVSGGHAGYAALYTQAPAWKDTVIVPRGGSVTQLVRVSDWRGTAMFHCHIVEHEDVGMLGMWELG
jgi:FtsP/CotA-like multicopper oxidase with cupredoxin domain